MFLSACVVLVCMSAWLLCVLLCLVHGCMGDCVPGPLCVACCVPVCSWLLMLLCVCLCFAACVCMCASDHPWLFMSACCVLLSACGLPHTSWLVLLVWSSLAVAACTCLVLLKRARVCLLMTACAWQLGCACVPARLCVLVLA